MWRWFFTLCSALLSCGGSAFGLSVSLQPQHILRGGGGAAYMQSSTTSTDRRAPPSHLKFGPSVDSNGCFQHRLRALDAGETPVTVSDLDEKFALVLVNYKLPRPLLERLWWNATVRVCADGAINRLYRTFEDEETRSKYIPEYIRGDLDSVEDDVRAYYVSKGTKIVQDLNQDTTDLEKCIELLLMLDLPINQAVVMGAFGGRIDHEFSHYHVLYKFPNINIILISAKRCAFLLREGKHHVHDAHLGPMCGLIPLGVVCKQVDTAGLAWDIKGDEMSFTGFISSSNKMETSPVSVSTSHPILWVSEIKTKLDKSIRDVERLDSGFMIPSDLQ